MFKPLFKLLLPALLYFFTIPSHYAQGHLLIGTNDSENYGIENLVEEEKFLMMVSPGGKTRVVSMDIYGNIFWAKDYYEDSIQPSGNPHLFDVGRNYNNELIFTGQVTRNNQYEMMLLSTDSIGNVQWSKHYVLDSSSGGNCGTEGRQLHLTSDSLLLVTGFRNCSTAGLGGLIIKFDLTGNVIWNLIIPALPQESVFPGKPIEVEGVYWIPYTRNYQAGLFRISETGSVLSHFLFSDTTEGFSQLVPMSDKVYMIGSRSSFSTGSGSDIRIVCMDTTGTILWKRGYYANLSQSARAFADGDSALIVFGEERAGLGDLENGTFVMKIDSSGTVKWYRGYNIQRKAEAIVAGMATADGYAFTGTVDGGYPRYRDIYLLKTDKNGFAFCFDTTKVMTETILSTSHTTAYAVDSVTFLSDSVNVITLPVSFLPNDTLCLVVSRETDKTESPEISVFPNPANESVTVQIPPGITGTMVITNPHGVKVFEMEATGVNETSLDICSWPRGLYFFSFMTDKGMYSRKVILE